MKQIAVIYNDYIEKFGIPRQSGLVSNLSKIVFEKEYRIKEAFDKLEEYSHIWLIWHFTQAERETWSPTVRPPKLGGNKRVGVFATRSPFRPNPIGLSCVKLVKIDYNTANAPVLIVEGADLMNGTPIYDIKPYVPYADCITEAKTGISTSPDELLTTVTFPEELKKSITKKQAKEIEEILKQDPHPAYKKDVDRIYKMTYGKIHVEFKTDGTTLTVTKIKKI